MSIQYWNSTPKTWNPSTRRCKVISLDCAQDVTCTTGVLI
jgi:hypothetical protein